MSSRVTWESESQTATVTCRLAGEAQLANCDQDLRRGHMAKCIAACNADERGPHACNADERGLHACMLAYACMWMLTCGVRRPADLQMPIWAIAGDAWPL